MSHPENTLLYERRQEWLEEQGRTEGDVMEDIVGEYILEIDIEEQGTPGDDYQCTERKTRVYLPARLRE